MFKNTFQSGFLSILYSIGSKPLQIWDKKVMNGHIKRITDNDIQSSVLEIMSTNISTTFVSCPADPGKTLGIKLPFLVMIIKNVRAAHRATARATGAQATWWRSSPHNRQLPTFQHSSGGGEDWACGRGSGSSNARMHAASCMTRRLRSLLTCTGGAPLTRAAQKVLHL